jgi:hypothetical protein
MTSKGMNWSAERQAAVAHNEPPRFTIVVVEKELGKLEKALSGAQE